MGRSKRLTRDSVLKVLMTTKEFVIYIYKITSNDKQFAKGLRASLVQDLRNTALNTYLTMREANSIYPTTKEAYKTRYKLQKKAKRLLARVEAMIDIAFQIANPSNTNYWAALYTQVSDELNAWIQSDRRRYRKNLPTEKQLRKERKEQAKRVKEFKNLPRDENGFIKIVRKSDPAHGNPSSRTD